MEVGSGVMDQRHGITGRSWCSTHKIKTGKSSLPIRGRVGPAGPREPRDTCDATV